LAGLDTSDIDDELPQMDELQWATDIFDEMDAEHNKIMMRPKSSNKARIVIDIATQAKAVNENILVFVHSIPTLEYLEEKLRNKRFDVRVLTGKTKMGDRQANIESFNKSKGAIYLISSRVI
jgi:superfamily II DNA or RNA helicase